VRKTTIKHKTTSQSQKKNETGKKKTTFSTKGTWPATPPWNRKLISHKTVNTFVPDVVAIPREKTQKKQKKLHLHPRKGRDKNYQNLKIQTQSTMGGGKHKASLLLNKPSLILLLSLLKIIVAELFERCEC